MSTGLLIAVAGLTLAALNIPIAIFLALWCTIFGGIPAYKVIHSVKDFGWRRGIRRKAFYLPLVLLGAAVAIYALVHAFHGTGWMFDIGIAVFICGLLVVAAGPAMARRSLKGVILAQRIRCLRQQLIMGQSGIDPAVTAAWSVALQCENEFVRVGNGKNPATGFLLPANSADGNAEDFMKVVDTLKNCLEIFPSGHK